MKLFLIATFTLGFVFIQAQKTPVKGSDIGMKIIVPITGKANTGVPPIPPPPTINESKIILDFGAKGDGISDDTFAFDSAWKYASTNKVDITMPSGIFRVTRQVVIGYKYVDEADFSYSYVTSAPSYNSVAYTNARLCQPVNFIGGSNTVIWGDFKPTKLTAIIYYGIIGGGNSNNVKLQPARHGFSNITILSQDRLVNGVYNRNEFDPTNLQVGLAADYAKNFKAVNMEYIGLDVGIMAGNLYASTLDNIQASHCGTGAWLYNHNISTVNNPNFQRCVAGMYLFGVATTVNNLWAAYCATGVTVKGRSVLLNGAYFENDDMTRPNVAQVIIDDGATLNRDTETRGAVLNGISGTAGGRDMILVKNVNQFVIQNSTIINYPIRTTFPTKIVSLNNTTPLSIYGAGATVKYLD